MRRRAAADSVALALLVLCLCISWVQAQPYYPDRKDEHVCPWGSYRSQKTLDCEPCPKGTYATKHKGRHSCAACPSGRTTLREGSTDIRQCVCQPGFGRPNGDAEHCVRCVQGTYSFGDSFDECFECPFPKTTGFSGATSDRDCVCPGGGGTGPDCDQCPQNMVLMANGVCGCAPGHGGTTCDQCLPGFYSTGGKANNPRPLCKPCGVHFTSPPGAIGPAYCQCESGYGAGPPDTTMWQHVCEICPIGTYNPGPGIGDRHTATIAGYGSGGKRRLPRASQCRPCNAANPHGGFTTIDVGATSVAQCVCAPGYGGPGCDICLTGTFSEGGKDAVCQSCPGEGAGYTTLYQGCTSVTSCVCLPGYGMSHNGLCRLCPANTYSEGMSKEDCKPCPFSYTSPPGSQSRHACVPASQPCPVGQIAPSDAVSPEECVCLPGHGGKGSRDEPCTPCAAGSWSPGTDTQACITCGWGYTSPVTATSPDECYPINACPAGTQYPASIKVPTSVDQCVCKPGFGSSTGTAPCHLCLAGTYSDGGSLEDCKPCPFGHTSAPGACGVNECKPVIHACPIGQVAPMGAVSQDQCSCYPGFGGGKTQADPCDICPAGTFSPGHATERCLPCGFGFTSPVGAKDERDCYPLDQCPAGTEVPQGQPGSTVHECKCKPGFGSPTGEGTCRLCPTASYSPGGTMEDCKPCPFGKTTRPGARSVDECEPVPQACPVGQVALPGAVSPSQCVCLPGHGGGRSPSEPCTACPSGSWSAGIDTQPCIPCGFGYTSPEAATCPEECYPINACPAGTQYPVFATMPVSIDQCVCKPGFGSSTGKGVCSLCPSGTYSEGGSMEDCKPCPWGSTSSAGATDIMECRPVNHPCPIGQYAPFGAVSAAECRCYKGFGGGNRPDEPCTICEPGTYSANIGIERCVPCGFGFTSPYGATGPEECYPVDQCPAGTQPTGETLDLGGPHSAMECTCKPGYGSVTGEGSCHLCPAGTYSKGGTKEDCIPCPFGYTSAPGTTSWKGCVPATQECPVGQLAPLGAVSKEECGCLPGHGGGSRPSDACSLCPVGSWSPGGDTQPCVPCDFSYTSPLGATCAEECYPINACPPGTLMPKYGASSPKECVCMPGFGTESQEGPCQMCPSGYYSPGFRRQPCLPCPFGWTSPPGAVEGECVPSPQPCPVGQIVDPADEPVSAADCHCLPGFGAAGATPQDGCTVCQPGTYSPGIGVQPCFPCPFGYTSPVGSLTPAACYEVEQCPGGTTPGIENPSSVRECACIPGFGSKTGRPGDPCFWCPHDTFNEGYNWDDCKACDLTAWAPPGSPECYPLDGEGPLNRTAPPLHFSRPVQPPAAAPPAFLLSSAAPLFSYPKQHTTRLAAPLRQARPPAQLQAVNAIGQLPRRRQGLTRRVGGGMQPAHNRADDVDGFVLLAPPQLFSKPVFKSADEWYSDAATGAPFNSAAQSPGNSIGPSSSSSSSSFDGQAISNLQPVAAAGSPVSSYSDGGNNVQELQDNAAAQVGDAVTLSSAATKKATTRARSSSSRPHTPTTNPSSTTSRSRSTNSNTLNRESSMTASSSRPHMPNSKPSTSDRPQTTTTVSTSATTSSSGSGFNTVMLSSNGSNSSGNRNSTSNATTSSSSTPTPAGVPAKQPTSSGSQTQGTEPSAPAVAAPQQKAPPAQLTPVSESQPSPVSRTSSAALTAVRKVVRRDDLAPSGGQQPKSSQPAVEMTVKAAVLNADAVALPAPEAAGDWPAGAGVGSSGNGTGDVVRAVIGKL